MKKAVKFIMVWALAITMVLSSQSLALASTNHTTGTLTDGLYAVSQLASSSTDQNIVDYRLSVLIADGTVSVVQFGQYGSGARFSKTFADYIPDEEGKAALLATCDEQDYYQAQANALLDGAKIDMYAEAVNDEMYNAFQALWKEAIEQAGGKVEAVAADTTTETTPAKSTSSDVPKTGVTGLGVVFGLATLATGSLALKKRK